MYPVTLKTFPSPSWLLSSSTPPFPFCPTKTSIITHNLVALACFSADLLPFRGPRWIQHWRQTRLLLSPPSVLFPGLFSPLLSSSLSRLSSLLFLTPHSSLSCALLILLSSLSLTFFQVNVKGGPHCVGQYWSWNGNLHGSFGDGNWVPSSKLGDRLCGRGGCGKSDAEGLTCQFCLGQSFRNQHYGWETKHSISGKNQPGTRERLDRFLRLQLLVKPLLHDFETSLSPRGFICY